MNAFMCKIQSIFVKKLKKKIEYKISFHNFYFTSQLYVMIQLYERELNIKINKTNKRSSFIIIYKLMNF